MWCPLQVPEGELKQAEKGTNLNLALLLHDILHLLLSQERDCSLHSLLKGLCLAWTISVGQEIC